MEAAVGMSLVLLGSGLVMVKGFGYLPTCTCTCDFYISLKYLIGGKF